MIQAIVPVSTQKQVMQEASVKGKSCSSPYTVVNYCTTFFIDSEENHQRHKTVVAPPISSMNAASQAYYDPMSLLFSPLTVSAAKPDLLQLLEMNFPSRVGPKITLFGSFLLQDTLGNKMANITKNCQGRPEDMAMEVLREWLAGKGVEVSWDSLIATLKKSKDFFMAEQIQMALDNL